ncbi:MAG: MFS transporter [Myxococcales bacterium]|nr:MFS transporter [Myxococcales bacterium]
MSSSPAPPAAPSAGRLERRVIWLVAMVQLVNVLDFVMVMPLGRDFARALAIDESRLGLIGGSYTLAAAIAGLVGSRFLDRFDRRRALTVAMLGLVTATAAGGLAQDLPSLMAARILAGAFGGPATSLSMAIVADVVPPARRGAAMGIVMSAFSVASVVGVPLGLYAAQLGSWRTPFFALAAIGLAVTGFAARALPPLRHHLEGPRHAATPTWALLRRKEIVMMLGAAAAMTWSVFMIVPYVRSFLQNNHHVPEGDIKFLYLVGGIASFAVVRLTGPTVDRVGSTPVAALGTALVTGALLVGFLPAAPLLPVFLVFSLFMCTASLRGVPLSALSSKLPAPHERAQYMSLQSAVQHLASSAGAITASQIIATAGDGHLVHVDVVVFASIGLALCMPVLLWRVERRVRARLAAAAAAVELPALPELPEARATRA